MIPEYQCAGPKGVAYGMIAQAGTSPEPAFVRISTPSSAGIIHAFATLRRNLLRCNVLAEDETYSENEGKAPWCEETDSESDGLQSACAGEDEAAPQAERLRETRESRSNSGHARC